MEHVCCKWTNSKTVIYKYNTHLHSRKIRIYFLNILLEHIQLNMYDLEYIIYLYNILYCKLFLNSLIANCVHWFSNGMTYTYINIWICLHGTWMYQKSCIRLSAHLLSYAAKMKLLIGSHLISLGTDYLSINLFILLSIAEIIHQFGIGNLYRLSYLSFS